MLHSLTHPRVQVLAATRYCLILGCAARDTTMEAAQQTAPRAALELLVAGIAS